MWKLFKLVWGHFSYSCCPGYGFLFSWDSPMFWSFFSSQVIERSRAVQQRWSCCCGRLTRLTDKICNDAGALRVSTGSAACCKLVTGGDLSGGLSVLPGVVVTWDLWEFAIAYKAQSDPVGRGRLVMSLLSLTAQLCAVIFLLILSLYSDSFSFPPTEPPRQSMNCVVLKLKWRFEPPTVQYTDLFYCSSPYWYTGFMY